VSEERTEYKALLAKMTDEELRGSCNRTIWLSAQTWNNPKAPIHWKCDAAKEECELRGKPEIYKEEFERLRKEASKGLKV